MLRSSLQRTTAALLCALFVAVTAQAKDDPGYGPAVDAFCSSTSGTTPFADLVDPNEFFNECKLCHNNGPFPANLPSSGNVSAQGDAWDRGGRDHSVFCPQVANNPPVLAAIGPQTATQGMLLTIPVSARDPDGHGIALAVANGPNGHQFTDNGNGTGTFTWTPGAGQVGSFQVTFNATDDGVPMATAMEVVTISVGQAANQPPAITAIADQSLSIGVPVSIAVSATDPDGDMLTLDVSPLPAGANFADNGDGTGSFDWTPGAAGNHALTATATDDGTPSLSATEGFTLTVGNVNRPPMLTPVGDRSVLVGMTLQVLLTATDPDQDGLGYAFSGLPADATYTDFGDGTAEILWTPSVAASFSVTVTVSDDGSPVESARETFQMKATDPVTSGNLVLDDAWWSFGDDESGDDSDSEDSDGDADADSDDSDDSDSSSAPSAEPSTAGPHKPRMLDFADPAWARRWRSSLGSLTVTGHGANPGERIAVFDGDSGALLGYGWGDQAGDFMILLMPFMAPCSVTVGIDAPASTEISVRGAPAKCGVEVASHARSAWWSCGTLEVKGKAGPPGGSADAYDADSGAKLANGTVDPSGDFLLTAAVATAPRAVRVDVSSGTGSWPAGTVDTKNSDRQCRVQPATVAPTGKKLTKKERKKRKKKRRRRSRRR